MSINATRACSKCYGQAPSDYPEVARYLVEQGIDAISLNPDSVVTTPRNLVAVAQSLFQTLRYLAQQRVADVVAHRIVEQFEVVQVEEEHGA